jgi:hypothetical protein
MGYFALLEALVVRKESVVVDRIMEYSGKTCKKVTPMRIHSQRGNEKAKTGTCLLFAINRTFRIGLTISHHVLYLSLNI